MGSVWTWDESELESATFTLEYFLSVRPIVDMVTITLVSGFIIVGDVASGVHNVCLCPVSP